MALHVLDEANRCLGCKKPSCQQGCPISTDIPEVIRLLKAGQMDKAGRLFAAWSATTKSSARATASATACPPTTRSTSR